MQRFLTGCRDIKEDEARQAEAAQVQFRLAERRTPSCRLSRQAQHAQEQVLQ